MIWLRSNERFNDLAELERESGKYRITDVQSLGPSTPAEIDGAFSILSGTLCALYRAEGDLYFRIGNAEFKLDSSTVLRVSGPAEARRVVVERLGRVIATHEYTAAPDAQFGDDPTPFVELADFDFGLFAANVSQSAERKAVLLGRSRVAMVALSGPIEAVAKDAMATTNPLLGTMSLALGAAGVPSEGLAVPSLRVEIAAAGQPSPGWIAELIIQGDLPWQAGEERLVEVRIASDDFRDYVVRERPGLVVSRGPETIGSLVLE
jgi:hypothetical protein